MTQLSDVQEFIVQSREASTLDELHGLLHAISKEMGFDYFALLHHVDLRKYSEHHDRILTNDFIALSNYPQYWIDSYLSDEIVNFDPVLLASQRTSVGFGWDQIPNFINYTEDHRRVVDKSKRAGIGDGFTIPANVPGELSGSCNFAVRLGSLAPQENFAMAQLVGAFAFQAARTIVARSRGYMETLKVELTKRQLECIVLVARGKSDWEIGRILNISEETVKQHIANARERYDVTKRMQVVLRALYDGHVPLSEMLC